MSPRRRRGRARHLVRARLPRHPPRRLGEAGSPDAPIAFLSLTARPSATREYAATTSAPAVTAAVSAATSSDTVRSRICRGKRARLLKNRWTDAWEEPGAPEPLPMPLQNLLVSEARQRLIRSGQPDVVPRPAGQIVGRLTQIRPVADVIADLVAEPDRSLDKLRNLR